MDLNIQFASDNTGGISPEIIHSISQSALSCEMPYGADSYSQKAHTIFEEQFGPCHVSYVSTGTASNVVALKTGMESFHSVVCTHIAHLHGDECGAFENIVRGKILTVHCQDGKITRSQLENLINSPKAASKNLIRFISLSQCTERGTVYTCKEIQDICELAHKNDIFVHVDGARLANAAVYLNVSFKEMITNAGIDILSLGGTKNGLLMGEAIVILNPHLSQNIAHIHKQCMQTISKMRFAPAQFIPYFEQNIAFKNAKQANDMALLLEKSISHKNPEISVMFPVQANMVFIKLPMHKKKEIDKKYKLYVIAEYLETDSCLLRVVTSYQTTRHDIETFCSAILAL
jgi:threonine aldolase